MKLFSMTATFGCLNHETLEFDQNMTIITAPNGGGKSTWCAFLRTMLYGLDSRQRDRKGDPADKNRYRPWSGALMEGTLLCEHEGEVIELRRTSEHGIPMGDFSAVYKNTGKPVPGLTGENVGETLLGVGREVFDRSAFLRQTGLAVDKSRELEQRINGLVTDGTEETSWTEADERLKGWQRRRRYHQSGRLPKLEQEETELGQTISKTAALRQELDETEARAESLRRRKAEWDKYMTEETKRFQTEREQRQAEAAAGLISAEERLRTLTAQYEAAGDKTGREEIDKVRADIRSRKRIFGVFLAIILVLTIVAAVVYAVPRVTFSSGIPLFPLAFLAGIVGVLWALVLLVLVLKVYADSRDHKELHQLREKYGQQEEIHRNLAQTLVDARLQQTQAQRYCESVNRESGPHLPPEAEACREALSNAEQEAALLRGQLSAIGDPAVIDARLDNVREEVKTLQADYDALEIAQEVLREADDQLHARFSPQICDRAGEYLEKLTKGRYTGFSLNREMEILVLEGDDPIPRSLSGLSQGTRDQLYFALRLAVADLALPKPDECPLVLDDALCSFDDERLASALDCLAELAEERQVLLFTCQKRESEAMKEWQGIGFRTLKKP